MSNGSHQSIAIAEQIFSLLPLGLFSTIADGETFIHAHGMDPRAVAASLNNPALWV
jgi:hypothetical protein